MSKCQHTRLNQPLSGHSCTLRLKPVYQSHAPTPSHVHPPVIAAGLLHTHHSYNSPLEAALAYNQAARMVNTVQDDTGAQPKPRRRPLNFPDDEHYDEELDTRLQMLLNIPAAEQSSDGVSYGDADSPSPSPRPPKDRPRRAAAATGAAGGSSPRGSEGVPVGPVASALPLLGSTAAAPHTSSRSSSGDQPQQQTSCTATHPCCWAA